MERLGIDQRAVEVEEHRANHRLEALPEQRDDRPLARLAAHPCAPVFDRHIELAAHAEAAGKIDAGFDRKAGAFDEAPVVERLEGVEIGACAVYFAADRMPGTMHKALAQARLFDHGARGAVGFAPADRLARSDALLDQLDDRVAGLGYDLKYARVLGGGF